MTYNTLMVLLGVGFLGAGAGMIGSFAVLRKRALLGDALSHAALPGLCLGFFALIVLRHLKQLVDTSQPGLWPEFLEFGERDLYVLLLGALATGLLGIAIVAFLSRWTRVRQDAAIGIVLSVFFGAGIVLLRFIQNNVESGSKAGLDSYIFGKAASMIAADVALIAGVAVACVALIALMFKEFLLVTFDPGFARVQGWPSGRIDLALTALVAVVVVIGLPAVGVVMMAALLIIPGVTARFWTDRLSRLVLLAGAVGVGIGLIGVQISASYHDMPTGPIITLVGTGMFLASALFAPRRGLVARVLARRRDAWKADYDEILRLLFESGERGTRFTELSRAKSWTQGRVGRLLATAARAGDVKLVSDSSCHLTDNGAHKAVEVVRMHRLWRMLLAEYPDLAPVARPLTGEPVETTIGSDLVGDLTRKLREAGQWPEARSMDSSLATGGVR